MKSFDAIWTLITNFFLFWYGVYWHNPEDIGIAIGIYAKTFSQLTLDEIEPIKDGWDCPLEF